MEYGTALGLSQDMGFDQRINDERYRQEALKRQQDQNAAKAKLFAADMDFQKAANQFDAPRVRDMNTKIVQEIGDYVSANPDWETNVQKMMVVKQLKTKLKDNPEVMRSVHSDSNYKELLTDLQERAKSGSQYDKDAYDDYLNKWNNYQQFGNQDGVEAAKAEGVKPFTYVRPQDFVDLPTKWLDIGKKVADFDLVDTGQGGYYSKPKQAQMDALVAAAYQQNGRQIQIEAAKLGLDTPEKIDNWVRSGISAGVQKHFKNGDSLGYWEASMRNAELNMKKQEAAAKAASSKSPDYTNWEYFSDLTSDGKDAKANPAGVLDDKLFHEVWGSTQDVKVAGSDGRQVDLSDLPFRHRGKYINKGGATFIPGYVDMPLDVAESKGIYQQGKFTIDGITSPFKNRATEVVITGKDGSTEKAIRVDYDLPINRFDQTTRQKYNIATNATKHLNPTPGEGEFEPNNSTGKGTYQGYEIGRIVKTSKGNFLVTPNGFKPQ